MRTASEKSVGNQLSHAGQVVVPSSVNHASCLCQRLLAVPAVPAQCHHSCIALTVMMMVKCFNQTIGSQSGSLQLFRHFLTCIFDEGPAFDAQSLQLGGKLSYTSLRQGLQTLHCPTLQRRYQDTSEGTIPFEGASLPCHPQRNNAMLCKGKQKEE